MIVEIASPLLPNRMMIRGVVTQQRNALPRLRIRAGITVAFAQEESHKTDFFFRVMQGKHIATTKRRHSRLPIKVPVRYRNTNAPEFIASELTEISIGGAVLTSNTGLDIGTEVVIEIIIPPSASASLLSGKVTYHRPDGSMGVRFLSRDGSGTARMKELIKRLKAQPHVPRQE